MENLYINHLAVFVCALLSLAIGALWYSPLLFFRAWQKETGLSDEQTSSSSLRTLLLYRSFQLYNSLAPEFSARFYNRNHQQRESYAMPARKTSFQYLVALLLLLICTATTVVASERWSAKLDGKVRFYQSTELGVLVAGTERSLYAVDGETGDVLWRRKNLKVAETELAPIPKT